MRRNIKAGKKQRQFLWLSLRGVLRAGRLGLVGGALACLVQVSQGQDALPPAPSLPALAEPGRIDASAVTTTMNLLQDRPIGQLQASIAPPTKNTPENVARLALYEEGTRPQPLGAGRGWSLQPLQWDASAVRHLPTYFEEPNLERLGYYYGSPCLIDAGRGTCDRLHRLSPCGRCRASAPEDWCDPVYGFEDEKPHAQFFQPLVSAANFYGRVVAIPYMIGAQHPNEEVYSLGEDRPGSPVPYRKYYIPLSLEGAFLQGSVATGLTFLIP